MLEKANGDFFQLKTQDNDWFQLKECREMVEYLLHSK